MMIPAESELKTCTSSPRSRCRIVRREVGQREVAEDDRRDPGEHLEDRLDGLAYARPRVLGEVDRRPKAEWDRHDQRDARDLSVPQTSGQTPKCGSANSGDHSAVGEELDDPDVAEERDRLLEQGNQDPDRREDRDSEQTIRNALTASSDRRRRAPPRTESRTARGLLTDLPPTSRLASSSTCRWPAGRRARSARSRRSRRRSRARTP